MSFGLALDKLIDGEAAGIRFHNWGDDVIIRLQRPDEHSKMTTAYLYVESRFGCVPWTPTQVELLSLSWELV